MLEQPNGVRVQNGFKEGTKEGKDAGCDQGGGGGGEGTPVSAANEKQIRDTPPLEVGAGKGDFGAVGKRVKRG